MLVCRVPPSLRCSLQKESILGLLTFIKDAGEKLFNSHSPSTGPQATAPSQSAPANIDTLNQTAASAILKYIATQNLPADSLNLSFDGATATVTVRGQVPDQATREKILLCCGNVHAVEHVNDQMTVATPSAEARYYTVKSGDTLSKIAKEMYGDANRYPAIFEANRPMLSNPDKIYPGQTLRIPPQ
jgi:nucleoid-associated protein YgaU